ncbi:hypothetical protein LTR78_005566 [Recurvomyces mirabilis]|uniref:Uncharacterized protein n=1 Tax=Recurvomyces mirabilis TaxID=574656 RepID=A0AAE0WMM6_9PEZI|nr:hypothetical protein LTR78_005566 [Recurvomyces mirabilis]
MADKIQTDNTHDMFQAQSTIGQPTPATSIGLQRLAWHTLHLCNVLLSQLGAYLSLEALHRDTCVDGLVVPIPHLPLLAAQAEMMGDVMRNLNAAADTLVRLPSHQEMKMQGTYRSLLHTAEAMGMANGLVNNGIKSKEDFEALRSAYDEMLMLCYGDAAKGIQGWKEMWNLLFE